MGIKIMPREVILDTQGRAVESSLKANGFQIDSCRVGKFIELTIAIENAMQAQSEIEKMLKEGGLYNPLIERYEIQTL
jgi:phosphoribosylformylglycinamidine synthase PurS subunit